MTYLALFVLTTLPALAWTPELLSVPPDERGLKPVIGVALEAGVIDESDTLIAMARREGVGYGNLVAANPHIDPWLPQRGQRVHLPLTTIPPQGLQVGITINLAELRLYHVWTDGQQYWVRVYPIGIGRIGLETPEGDFHIANKVKNPSWRVPQRIRDEDPLIPAIVPPGPDNPLGHRWLGLSADSYGIHGTSKPLGIGRRVSSGCIRLYPEDIDLLFASVAPATPVRIVYQPIKLGVKNGHLFLQVHEDFDRRIASPVDFIRQQLLALAPSLPVDINRLTRIVAAQTGKPTVLAPIPPRSPGSVHAEATLPNSSSRR